MTCLPDSLFVVSQLAMHSGLVIRQLLLGGGGGGMWVFVQFVHLNCNFNNLVCLAEYVRYNPGTANTAFARYFAETSCGSVSDF